MAFSLFLEDAEKCITTPMHRNEVKLLFGYKGCLRPVIGNVRLPAKLKYSQKIMKRFGSIILPVFAQSFLLMLPVQATHKEINGCGDDSGLGRFVPNQPVGVDFRPVCDNHDECYGTLGESREQCDNVFRSALRAKCEKTLLRSAGGILGTVVTGGQALTSCYGVAEVYYRSVRERGGTAYSKAQNHAREEQQGSTPNPKLSGGIFLRNQWSGKCLQTMGQDKDNGSLVNIWDCTNTSNQSWVLSDRGELRHSWSGKCLQTMGQDKDNGSPVNIWDCTGTLNQFWQRTNSGEIRNMWSGKCLQTMGQNKDNGSSVNIWDCTGTSNQSWR